MIDRNTKAPMTQNHGYTLPFLNYQIEDLEGEEWRDILGYDGIYLVSNLGRIKSCQRKINMGAKGVKIQPERIMKQQVSRSNFNNIKEPSKSLKVTFCVDNIKKTYHVTTLVGNAFIGQLKDNEVYSKTLCRERLLDIEAEKSKGETEETEKPKGETEETDENKIKQNNGSGLPF